MGEALLEAIAFILVIIGAILALSGSWYTTSGNKEERHYGYLLWMCGNPINIAVMGGIILGLWSGLPLIITILIQVYYFYTAHRGWKTNGGSA